MTWCSGKNARAWALVRRGFSLMEILLALGILSFCLVALLAIFSVGFRASMKANEDTVLASIASRIMSEARASSSFPFPTNMLFDTRGLPVSASSEATYACEVTRATVPESQLPGISTNLSMVTMKISWPAAIAAQDRKGSQIFHATK